MSLAARREALQSRAAMLKTQSSDKLTSARLKRRPSMAQRMTSLGSGAVGSLFKRLTPKRLDRGSGRLTRAPVRTRIGPRRDLYLKGGAGLRVSRLKSQSYRVLSVDHFCQKKRRSSNLHAGEPEKCLRGTTNRTDRNTNRNTQHHARVSGILHAHMPRPARTHQPRVGL